MEFWSKIAMLNVKKLGEEMTVASTKFDATILFSFERITRWNALAPVQLNPGRQSVTITFWTTPKPTA
jgi:hypothetical protein